MNELKGLIENLFPLYPVPSLRLSDAITLDRNGDNSGRFQEAWNNWKEIEDWQVEKCCVVFSFLPPEQSVYYIPRYMLWVLGTINKTVADPNNSISGDCLVWHLMGLKKNIWQDSYLNREQIDVIEKFLIEIAKDPDYQSTIDCGP